MLAVLALGSFSFIPSLSRADFFRASTSANLRGLITDWGSTQVFGSLGAHASVVNKNGTVHESAMVHATWSPDMKFNHTETDDEAENENHAQLPAGNITLSFYAAKLVNTTDVAFNSSGYDLIITGLWNVFNITQTLEIDAEGKLINLTRTMTLLVTNATGDLKVTAPHFPPLVIPPLPGNFTLTIAGIDPVTGKVFKYFQRDFAIMIGDLDAKGKTNIHDLVKVAHGYGTMPGMPGYSEYFDFDFNLEVDIGDLATVAQSIEP